MVILWHVFVFSRQLRKLLACRTDNLPIENVPRDVDADRRTTADVIRDILAHTKKVMDPGYDLELIDLIEDMRNNH